MQLSDRALSKRYALAFYQWALEKKEEEKAKTELAHASHSLSTKMGAFKHPRTPVKVKKALLRQELGDSVSSRTLRFLDLLIEKKRFYLLPIMAADFGHIYDEGKGIAHAGVRSASELSVAEKEALAKKLGKFMGKEVVLGVKIDPELLAGLVVRMGDWVFDSSLQGELRRLKARLTA